MSSSTSYADDALVPLGVGAEIAGVSTATLRNYADDGKLPVYRSPGNQRRFKVRDLKALHKLEQPVADVAPDEPAAATG